MAIRVEQRVPTRYKFTTEDYQRMLQAGILTEDSRVELVDGEVIDMTPIGIRHAACVDRLSMLLNRVAAQYAIVRVQSPIHLGNHSEPQPDVALLRPRDDFYAGGHPKPADILLVIEVADTSQEYDRSVKVPLYAQAGIPEYWLVDLTNNTVEVYSQPSDGKYKTVKQVVKRTNEARLEVPGGGSVTLNVRAILG